MTMGPCQSRHYSLAGRLTVIFIDVVTTIKRALSKSNPSRSSERFVLLSTRCKQATHKTQNKKNWTSKTIEVLNHTRFERITFRSGVERATVAPAVLAFAWFDKIFPYSLLWSSVGRRPWHDLDQGERSHDILTSENRWVPYYYSRMHDIGCNVQIMLIRGGIVSE